MWNDLANGDKAPHYYNENKFGYGDKLTSKISIGTIQKRMRDAIKDHPTGYGKEGTEREKYKDDLEQFPNSVKNIGRVLHGNGKDVRSFFVLGQLGKFEEAKKIQIDISTKIGNLDIEEFDRQLKELVAQK